MHWGLYLAHHGFSWRGAFSFTATNQGCSNFFGGATITFSGTIGQPGCNYVYGYQLDADGTWYDFGVENAYPTTEPPLSPNWVAKAVDVPTSETTVIPPPAAWNPTTGGAPWNQTLAPDSPSGEFAGRAVYEYQGGPGNDTCWFPGSKWAVYDSITNPGGGWYVTSKNKWGADWIGWKLAAVQYYQSLGRAPCGTSFLQQMVIDAAYSPDNTSGYAEYTDNHGDVFYGVPFEVNTLGANITATAASSVRNGKTSINTTW